MPEITTAGVKVKMSKFWRFKTVKNKIDEENESTENVLFLNGVIAEESWYSDDVTPKMFRDELNRYDGDITVWINSPGGDCFAASEIYTALKEHNGKEKSRQKLTASKSHILQHFNNSFCHLVCQSIIIFAV